MKEYIVIMDDSIERVEARVTSCLQEGYFPVGGISFNIGKNGESFYLQAIIR